MPANRRDRRLTGSFKPSQAAPALVYSKPPRGELNAEQKALLKLRPKRLSMRQKLAFRRAVLDAQWLTTADLDLLVRWVQANDRYRRAATALDRCLSDPAFARSPTPAMSKVFAMHNQVAYKESMLMISLGHKLGFSPAGRNALGLQAKAPASDEDDAWAQLRLVPGGRPGDAG